MIEAAAKTPKFGERVLGEGAWVSLDGSAGEVMAGKVQTIKPELDADFDALMELADQHRTLGVRANADTPRDAQVARDFGSTRVRVAKRERRATRRDQQLLETAELANESSATPSEK